MKKKNKRTFLGLCDPTIFMACDCTAFTAREIGFPRSVGFLRGGMVRACYKTVVLNTPTRRAARLGKGKRNAEFRFSVLRNLKFPLREKP